MELTQTPQTPPPQTPDWPIVEGLCFDKIYLSESGRARTVTLNRPKADWVGSHICKDDILVEGQLNQGVMQIAAYRALSGVRLWRRSVGAAEPWSAVSHGDVEMIWVRSGNVYNAYSTADGRPLATVHTNADRDCEPFVVPRGPRAGCVIVAAGGRVCMYNPAAADQPEWETEGRGRLKGACLTECQGYLCVPGDPLETYDIATGALTRWPLDFEGAATTWQLVYAFSPTRVLLHVKRREDLGEFGWPGRLEIHEAGASTVVSSIKIPGTLSLIDTHRSAHLLMLSDGFNALSVSKRTAQLVGISRDVTAHRSELWTWSIARCAAHEWLAAYRAETAVSECASCCDSVRGDDSVVRSVLASCLADALKRAPD